MERSLSRSTARGAGLNGGVSTSTGSLIATKPWLVSQAAAFIHGKQWRASAGLQEREDNREALRVEGEGWGVRGGDPTGRCSDGEHCWCFGLIAFCMM